MNRQLETDTQVRDRVKAIMEKIANNDISADDSMIPIGHPMRQEKMLTFKQYVQAKGKLHENYHVPLEQLNDRQLHDFIVIAEAERKKTLEGGCERAKI